MEDKTAIVKVDTIDLLCAIDDCSSPGLNFQPPLSVKTLTSDDELNVEVKKEWPDLTIVTDADDLEFKIVEFDSAGGTKKEECIIETFSDHVESYQPTHYLPNLKRATQTPSYEKPFKCDQSEKEFSQFSNINEYTRVHSGGKPYKCKQCGKGFSRRTSLKKHTRNCDKQFKCDLCGKRFLQLRDLTLHTQTHSGERPFKCDQCGKAFSLLHSLQIINRTQAGEIQFECGRCGKAFSQLNGLNIHIRIHTGEPYRCHQCSKALQLQLRN